MIPKERGASTASLMSCRSGAQYVATPSATTMSFLDSLSHAEERVMATWSRIGLAEVDRENKWVNFVVGRLLPFLQDYVRLQDSEEIAMAAENDRLFSEMLFASVRLKEAPRMKELAQLVDAVLDQGIIHTTTTTTTTTTLREGEKESEREKEDASRESVWDVPPLNNSHACSEVASDGKEQRIVPLVEGANALHAATSFPSFVAVTHALLRTGDTNTCSRRTSFPSRTPDESYEPQPKYIRHEHNSRSPSMSLADSVTTHSQAWAMLWQFARSMTHQELHRNLEREVQRMNALADVRLQQLCLLYKQRALLQLPPQEQIAVRAKYAEKFLSGEFNRPLCEATMKQLSTSEPHSTSGGNDYGRGVATPGLSSGRTTASRSNPAVMREEFDLLSDCIPERLRTQHDCVMLDTAGETNSSTLRVEEEEEKGNTKKNEEKDVSGRGTIFDVDLGDVTRFGRRQDLSLARIDAETQEIHAEIIAQNMRMANQAEEELRCVEELWDLLENGTWEKNTFTESNNNNKEKVTEENGGTERLISRQQFMNQVMQLRQEYEEGMGAAEEVPPHLDETLSHVTGTGDSSVHSSRRVTCTSRSYPLSRTRSRTRESNNNRSSCSSSNMTIGHSITVKLPTPLIKIFAARSYAPVLAYIVATREHLQHLLLQRHVEVAKEVTQELTEMYKRYFDQTQNVAYSVAPDYSLWLRENADAAIDTGSSAHVLNAENNKINGKNECFWRHILLSFTSHKDNDALRERMAEVKAVVSRATLEVQVLRERLKILSELEPLLQRRMELLEQQRIIQEGSRERLLSKKVNMAKQLLYEENARRQFTRELPRIYEHMEELLCQWQATEGENCANESRERLLLHGVDIAAMTEQARLDAARLTAARTMSRGGHSPTLAPPTTTTTPQRRGPTVSVSTSPGTRINAAKKNVSPVNHNNNNNNKSGSCSPLPVKQTAAMVRRHGIPVSPAVNEFLRREPRAVPLRGNYASAKKASASPGSSSMLKK